MMLFSPFLPIAMQAAVQRIHNYVQTLEEKVEAIEKKK